jgi:hypothetical protein
VLGLSLLVDSIDHPKPPQSTEGTVLGLYIRNCLYHFGYSKCHIWFKT